MVFIKVTESRVSFKICFMLRLPLLRLFRNTRSNQFRVLHGSQNDRYEGNRFLK